MLFLLQPQPQPLFTHTTVQQVQQRTIQRSRLRAPCLAWVASATPKLHLTRLCALEVFEVRLVCWCAGLESQPQARLCLFLVAGVAAVLSGNRSFTSSSLLLQFSLKVVLSVCCVGESHNLTATCGSNLALDLLPDTLSFQQALVELFN